MAQWQIKGKYIEACNCNTGCPCNYAGFPTHGNCEANVATLIEEGQRDGVDLSGAKWAVSVKWPKAIHEGNGTMAVFLDATEKQREALVPILTAEDGGLPFEILAATISDIKGPYFEDIEFKVNGTSTSVRVGDKLLAELEPLRNPVTGEINEVHTIIPGGFIWSDGHAATTVSNFAKGDLKFDHKGNSAYYAEVEWSNAEKHDKVAGTKF